MSAHRLDERLDRVVKAYDLRGQYPGELDEQLARAVGRAFVAVTGAGCVAVGQDMRLSSEPLASAFADGAAGQGADVVRVGLCSTDMLYFVAGHLDVAGAMFTASHNPSRYNGIKLCRAGAVPVGEESGLAEIKRLAASAPPPPAAARGRILTRDDLLPRYAEHVRGFVDAGALRPLRVVVDAGNGMAGHVLPAVFGGTPGGAGPLPFELVPMYFELDGTFPNHPANPIEPENLEDLRKRVVAEGADVGLAFDGDADRVFLVDEQGATVPSSLVGALVARTMLEREAGGTVLYNLICSQVVPETIRAAGGRAVRTRVGHSFIKQVMAQEHAVFGCEHSGHYYFRDNYRADSGLIAALVVLDVLSRAGAPLSRVLAPYRTYVQSGEINRRVPDPRAVVESAARAWSRHEQDRTDGLTVRGDGWWFNLRPSNTEPLLRLNVEARDEAEMGRIRDEVLGRVGGEPA
ncbi:MAG TPA: phosphomannomutase/phosphoglucomutase [Actinomycetes bacterium]|nr:phosphomannomutase/phosphoglucomutase [Actinomycetes bacterium]